eukprot:6198161-Pleurochrysis_carterae.AAC.8
MEGEKLDQLPSAQGLNEAISKQRGKQFVGLRRREWCGVVGGEEESRLACTRLYREGRLEVSERFRSITRHVDVGKGDDPVAPDFTRCITLALARGDFAPVSCREGLQLSRRGVLRGDTSDQPEQRGAQEPGLLLRQVSNQFSFAKAADVEQAERDKESSAKKRGFG